MWLVNVLGQGNQGVSILLVPELVLAEHIQIVLSWELAQGYTLIQAYNSLIVKFQWADVLSEVIFIITQSAEHQAIADTCYTQKHTAMMIIMIVSSLVLFFVRNSTIQWNHQHPYQTPTHWRRGKWNATLNYYCASTNWCLCVLKNANIGKLVERQCLCCLFSHYQQSYVGFEWIYEYKWYNAFTLENMDNYS